MSGEGTSGERSGADGLERVRFVAPVHGNEPLQLDRVDWRDRFPLKAEGDVCRHRRHVDLCEECFQILTPRSALALTAGAAHAAMRLEVASAMATNAVQFSSISGLPMNLAMLLVQVDRSWRSLWLWDLYVSIRNHGYGLLFGEEPWPDSDLDALALELSIDGAREWLLRVDELGHAVHDALPSAGRRDRDLERLRVLLEDFRGSDVTVGPDGPLATLSAMGDAWF